MRKKKYILWGRWEVYQDNRKYVEYALFVIGIISFSYLIYLRYFN